MARFLYVLSRERPAAYERLYEQMRLDMGTGSVELTFDRRRRERRRQAEEVDVERRRQDRRQHHVEEDLARVGWARVEMEVPSGQDSGVSSD